MIIDLLILIGDNVPTTIQTLNNISTINGVSKHVSPMSLGKPENPLL